MSVQSNGRKITHLVIPPFQEKEPESQLKPHSGALAGLEAEPSSAEEEQIDSSTALKGSHYVARKGMGLKDLD